MEHLKEVLIKNQDFEAGCIIDSFEPNGLTYHHECDDILNKYNELYGDEADLRLEGKEYKSCDWERARFDYANIIYMLAQQSELYDAINECEKELQDFNDTLREYFSRYYPNYDIDDLKVSFSSDCEYGWEAHNYESVDGTCFWDKNIKSSYHNFLNDESLAARLAISKKLSCGVHVSICISHDSIESIAK